MTVSNPRCKHPPAGTGSPLLRHALALVLWVSAGLFSTTSAADAAELPESELRMYRGDVEGALEAARAEAAADPNDIDARERQNDILLSIGLYDRAEKLARAWVEEAPRNPDAHYLLGRALADPRAAQASYERALKIEPMHARSHMGLGAIYTSDGTLGKAIEAYGRAVRFDSSLTEAWAGLMRSQMATDDVAAATQTAQQSIEAVPSDPEGYLALAVLKPGSARETLEAGARQAGYDPRLQALLAEVRLSAGDAPGALSAARRALEIDPTEPNALKTQLFAREIVAGNLSQKGYRTLLDLGDASAEPGRYDGLVTAHPRSALVLAGRSRAHLAAGSVEKARADLEAAVKLQPEEAEFQAAYGLLLLKSGSPREAVAPLIQASRARAWDGSLGIALARALTGSGDHEGAVAASKALSEARPYDSEASIAHADALLAAGNPEAAYQVVLAAAERRMDDKLVVALMAAAAQSGRFAEAAEIMEQIAEATGDSRAKELAAKLRAKAQ
jgi:tetratricopeptide (TPR) repeat protein